MTILSRVTQFSAIVPHYGEQLSKGLPPCSVWLGLFFIAEPTKLGLFLGVAI